ncbi:MAG: glycoside hydrolase family 36 protein [Acidobacteriota bacterium]
MTGRKNISINNAVLRLVGLMLIVLVFQACSNPDHARIEGENLVIEFNQSMQSRILSASGGEESFLGDYRDSERLLLPEGCVQSFLLSEVATETFSDAAGSGEKTILEGEGSGLTKSIAVYIYDDFPDMAVFEVTYTNTGQEALEILGWENNAYHLAAPFDTAADEPAFWAYQSASHRDRRDWVLPLEPGYSEENYLGMNASDYGGGTPVTDIWNRNAGVAVGHVEMVPKLVSLPVKSHENGDVEFGVTYKNEAVIEPGDSLSTMRTFVSLHSGDFFAALEQYRSFMIRQGITFDPFPDSAYEPVWCAWGYGRDFTMKQIYGALPKAKELGFKWAVLDDGWQTAEGDWFLNPDKYPNGVKDMKRFTDTIREAGLRPKLWWAPLAVDPGTELLEEHPEYALINKDGEYQKISWWDAYYICPAWEPAREQTRELVRIILEDFGYDGLKIDGQHLNAAPPCYNPDHNHARPEEAVEAIPGYFKMIYDTALEIVPDAVVEICPCGTAYSFFTMPYMNQPVSSDPLSSWQIRLKGKTMKALMGRNVPYYGDHVELSDNRNDFASTVGIGGVPGTKFTWPEGSNSRPRFDLTPEKEQYMKHWLEVYEEHMLPKENYRGELYDIGYDKPEAHAVQKDEVMYYAFYAESYDGELELRGLEEGLTYNVRDYYNDTGKGSVSGPEGKLQVSFSGSLLLEAVPIDD